MADERRPFEGALQAGPGADMAGLEANDTLSLKMTKANQAWTSTAQVPVRIGGAQ